MVSRLIGGYSQSQLTEIVNLEMGESIINGVELSVPGIWSTRTCKCVTCILCSTIINYANKRYHFRTVGVPFLPYVH